MNKEENLKLWNSVEQTNPTFTKTGKQGGRVVTSINPEYQIKNATNQWGSYGDTWGLKNIQVDYIHEKLTNNQVLAVGSAIFYYPSSREGVDFAEFEISSSVLVQMWVNSKSYNSLDNDFRKKLDTSMISKALSKLGFNADIFMTLFDDADYVNKLNMDFNPNVDLLKTSKDVKQFKKIYNTLPEKEKKDISGIYFEMITVKAIETSTLNCMQEVLKVVKDSKTLNYVWSLIPEDNQEKYKDIFNSKSKSIK